MFIIKENLKNKISQNKVENVRNDEIGNLEITHKDINKIDNNMSNEKLIMIHKIAFLYF